MKEVIRNHRRCIQGHFQEPVFPQVLLLFLAFSLMQNCQRFEPEGFFNVNTSPVSTITSTTAQAGGEVTDDGGSPVTARGVCWGTSSEPVISGSRTQDGSGTGSFTSTLAGLVPSTTYYVRAYATNGQGTTYGDEQQFSTTAAGTVVTDIDGNEYQTVQIGSQLWMAGNLKTTHFADGSAIPLVEGTAAWDALTATDKAYCWYDNSTANRDSYGGLYTWAAAVNGTTGSDENPSGIQGVCPDGWHLPSDAEWKQLEMYLGMSQAEADAFDWRGTDEGGQLKETGTTHWTSPNTGATNESGFTALPGGYRNNDGPFISVGDYAVFWTATGSSASDAYSRSLGYNIMNVYRYNGSKNDGYSIRCIQGETSVDLPTVVTSSISDETSNSAVGGGVVTDDGGAAVTERGVCWSTTSLPTISDDTTVNGSGTGTFTSHITRLAPLTTYYVRAYATNSAGTAYGEERSFSTLTNIGTPVSDIDGNEYQTVQIGEQLWMAENLKTTRYADGTEIPLVEGDTEWANLGAEDKAYCYYDNTKTNRDLYGGMYTWAAAMNGAASSDASPSGVQGVCPDGWRLPTDEDWKQLEIYLGISRQDADKEGSRGTDEGGQLKETGTAHWKNPNSGATNVTGFTALPGGYRSYGGTFSYLGDYASFWTATESDATLAWGRYLGYDYSSVYRSGYFKDYGFSVRCIQAEAAIDRPSVTTSSISNVTSSSAVGGGEVTDIGGAAVTARGVCWSTTTPPTLADDTTLDGSGIGSYTSQLTGLDPNTTYYVRAYATNSAGTAYGNEESFNTPAYGVPTVTTGSATSITGNSATLNGTVTNDGGNAVTDRGFYYGSSQNPVTTGTQVPEGSGTGAFSSTVTGLSAGTTYYFVAYATNSTGTVYGYKKSFNTWSGTVSDIDGNVYPTVQIGDQLWMVENLKTTRYADGSSIPHIESSGEWDALSASGRAYCWYDNSTTNRDSYGGLYTWAAAMKGAASSDANPSGVQGVCPDGWHLPSDAEWKELEMFLGMTQADADTLRWRGTDEGGKMKEAGTDHWSIPNAGATNESGFLALPGSFRSDGGSFYGIGDYAYFWTASELDASNAWGRHLGYEHATVYRNYAVDTYGFSVRCIHD